MISVRDAILSDLWVHLAAVIAIALGIAGWYSVGLSHDPTSVQIMFIIGGLAGLGLKIVNGSAAALRTAIVAQQVASAGATPAGAGVQVIPPVAPPAIPSPPAVVP